MLNDPGLGYVWQRMSKLRSFHSAEVFARRGGNEQERTFSTSVIQGGSVAMKKRRKKAEAKAPRATGPIGQDPSATTTIPDAMRDFLGQTATPMGFVNPKPLSVADLREVLIDLNVRSTVPPAHLVTSVNRVKPDAGVPEEKQPEEIRRSVRALKPEFHRFHGAKLALSWFPFPALISSCADRFGYRSSVAVRAATKLPFNVANQALLGQLGGMMGDPGRDPDPGSNNPADLGVSVIPAGYTYFGQFVDHDITLDISSSLDAATDANTINNMRTPSLDLDSLYSRGPGLDPFLYAFPSAGPPTAIKFQLGTNSNVGPGGPSNTGGPGGMVTRPSCVGYANGYHRRFPQRREPDRGSVSPCDDAISQRCGGPAVGRVFFGRHFRGGQEDRDAPLPVGGGA